MRNDNIPTENFPDVLKRNIYITIFIGIACFLSGLTYHICIGDRTFLILSLLVLAVCFGKAVDLFITVKHNKYLTTDAECTEVKYGKLFRNRITVKFSFDEETNISLGAKKNDRFIVGSRYRIYYLSSHTDDELQTVFIDDLLGYSKL